jgi:hypothetical protein
MIINKANLHLIKNREEKAAARKAKTVKEATNKGLKDIVNGSVKQSPFKFITAEDE